MRRIAFSTRSKLFTHNRQRFVLQTGRAPAKLRIDLTINPGVKKRKNDAEYACVGIDSANQRLANLQPAQLFDLIGGKSVPGFFQDDIPRCRFQKELALGRSRKTGGPFEFTAKERVRLVEELRENSQWKFFR